MAEPHIGVMVLLPFWRGKGWEEGKIITVNNSTAWIVWSRNFMRKSAVLEMPCLTYTKVFPEGSEVKNPPAKQEIWVEALGWEDPLEKGMVTYSSIMPGKSHGQRSLVGYSSWGCNKSDTTEWLNNNNLYKCLQSLLSIIWMQKYTHNLALLFWKQNEQFAY